SSGGSGEESLAGQPLLEQAIYAVCREGTTRARADRAYAALRDGFFDWNEVRVSAAREVAVAFAGMPDAMERAERVVGILQEVFETTYSYDLESLHKKGQKPAQKQLERYRGTTPFVVAYVLNHGLGAAPAPLDKD